MPLQLAVIIGGTREGRAGDRIGRWFAGQARQHDLTVTVVDLAGYDFPARHPAQPTASIRSFVQQVHRAEAFDVVTPEYNHSFPASLNRRSTSVRRVAGQAGLVGPGAARGPGGAPVRVLTVDREGSDHE